MNLRGVCAGERCSSSFSMCSKNSVRPILELKITFDSFTWGITEIVQEYSFVTTINSRCLSTCILFIVVLPRLLWIRHPRVPMSCSYSIKPCREVLFLSVYLLWTLVDTNWSINYLVFVNIMFSNRFPYFLLGFKNSNSKTWHRLWQLVLVRFWLFHW